MTCCKADPAPAWRDRPGSEPAAASEGQAGDWAPTRTEQDLPTWANGGQGSLGTCQPDPETRGPGEEEEEERRHQTGAVCSAQHCDAARAFPSSDGADVVDDADAGFVVADAGFVDVDVDADADAAAAAAAVVVAEL